MEQRMLPMPSRRCFSMLNFDILRKIVAPFSRPNLQAASLVCKSWRDALKPLRESIELCRLGRQFKNGGPPHVQPNIKKALDLFLQGAALGSTLAMVEVGNVYWEAGEKENAATQFRRAAELGDSAGQHNMGIYYLQVQPPNPKEAMKWFKQSAENGYNLAQYELALCLHRGQSVQTNKQVAIRWYQKAAEGGNHQAMYSISHCYKFGDGLSKNNKLARKWLKKAADNDNSKAQLELGLALCSEGKMTKAAVHLELAELGGEREASHMKEVVHNQLSQITHFYVRNRDNLLRRRNREWLRFN